MLSGMVVHQDDGGSGEFERALDHLARIDRRVIDGADLLDFVGDELVALVEKQHAELLAVGEGHARRGNSRARPTMTTAPGAA